MSDLTRAELETTAKWFDCLQSERLNCGTLADALCELIDQAGQDFYTLEDVTVDCYVPHEWHEKRRQWWAEDVLDRLLEAIDEDDELQNEDVYHTSVETKAALLAASRAFIDVVAEHVKPGMAREIGSFSVPLAEAIEIIRAAEPDLLEQVPCP